MERLQDLRGETLKRLFSLFTAVLLSAASAQVTAVLLSPKNPVLASENVNIPFTLKVVNNSSKRFPIPVWRNHPNEFGCPALKVFRKPAGKRLLEHEMGTGCYLEDVRISFVPSGETRLFTVRLADVPLKAGSYKVSLRVPGGHHVPQRPALCAPALEKKMMKLRCFLSGKFLALLVACLWPVASAQVKYSLSGPDYRVYESDAIPFVLTATNKGQLAVNVQEIDSGCPAYRLFHQSGAEVPPPVRTCPATTGPLISLKPGQSHAFPFTLPLWEIPKPGAYRLSVQTGPKNTIVSTNFKVFPTRLLGDLTVPAEIKRGQQLPLVLAVRNPGRRPEVAFLCGFTRQILDLQGKVVKEMQDVCLQQTAPTHPPIIRPYEIKVVRRSILWDLPAGRYTVQVSDPVNATAEFMVNL